MSKLVQFLGLEIEGGADQCGTRFAPTLARYYFSLLRFKGNEVKDNGNISQSNSNPCKLHNVHDFQIVDWGPYYLAYLKIQRLLKGPGTLLNWGGDHSVGISTVGAFSSIHPEGKVLWIDAHADLNIPEFSPSGNLHGMPLAILLNLNNSRARCLTWIENSLRPQNLIYLGLREVDPYENEIIRKLNIQVFTIQDIKKYGISSIAQEILGLTYDRPLHISFDVDGLNPEFAPSTGLHVPLGLSLRDIQILGEMLSHHSRLCSIDVTEINPTIGSGEEIRRTYLSAFSFIQTLFNQNRLYDILPAPMM